MNILFVCTGNTCRSAMAEALLKKAVRDKVLKDFSVNSCGTSTLPYFAVPHVVVLLMKNEGIDISSHKSTQINESLVNEADLILAMEEGHREYIINEYPEAIQKVHLLKEYSYPDSGDTEIPDPIGQSEEVYKATVAQLKNCIARLIEKIRI